MRINNPKSYIDWLKTTPSFRNGELDNLPKYCVVIHDSLILEHLTLLGYSIRNYNIFKIGATDPIEFLLVRDTNSNFEFILMNGLPGAGGISTQVAELSALGCQYIVHIGTCGLFNQQLQDGLLIVSNGSLKDQAALLLSQDDNLISKPSKDFLEDFEFFLNKNNIKYQSGIGVTIPIFYHQPTEFIKPFLQDNNHQFIEMEQAPFFETCKLNNVKGVSLVIGSDRYILRNKDITHNYIELDQNEAKNKALKVCIDYFMAHS